MDQNDNDKLWGNPQSPPASANAPKGQSTGGKASTAQPGSQSPTSFLWEESLPTKEATSSQPAEEIPPQLADFAPKVIQPQIIPQPKTEEELAKKILPGQFIVARNRPPEPGLQTTPSASPPQRIEGTETNFGKGIIFFSLVGLFLLIGLAAGGFFIWQNYGQGLAGKNQLPTFPLPIRVKPIERVIPGYGQTEPSIVSIEETFELEKYLDPDKKFTIQKPKDWSANVNENKVISFLKQKPDKDSLGCQYVPKIEISLAKSGKESLKDYFAKIKSEISSQEKNQIIDESDVSEKDFSALSLEVIVWGAKCTINASDAQPTVSPGSQTSTSSAGQSQDFAVHFSKLAVGYKDNFYLITASALEEKWNNYHNLFNAVLTSFSPVEET